MNPRTLAREIALQCLHQWDQRGPGDGSELADEWIRSSHVDEDTAEYARRLLLAYWENDETLDARIDAAAENWNLSRMAVVDRCVLRLATAEMLHVPEIPSRVSVDEAIELAKRFSTEKSGAFVNGILDRILKDWEGNHGTG